MRLSVSRVADREIEARTGLARPSHRGSGMPRDHDGLFADDVREPGRRKERVEGLFQGAPESLPETVVASVATPALRAEGSTRNVSFVSAAMGEDLLQRGLVEVERTDVFGAAATRALAFACAADGA